MLKILVVDDEATITTNLEERLARMGYEVVGTAASGEEAVRLAGEKQPDLILMDVVMPGKLDGIDAALAIKRSFDIPVVFLTAYGDDKYITRAKEVEPFGYIIKPFQEKSLKAAIEIAHHNRNTIQKMRSSSDIWKELTENTQDGIILCDDSGKIFFWNQGANVIFGYPEEEAAGKPLTFLISEGTEENLKQIMEALVSGGIEHPGSSTLEAIGVRKDWSKFPVEINLTPMTVEKDTTLLCVARDITERRKVQSRLQTSLQEKDIQLQKIKDQVQKDMDVIRKILNFQMEYAKDKKSLSMIRNSRERIESLARMHEKLGSVPSESELNFEAYINSLIRRLYDAYKVSRNRIKPIVRVDDFCLDMPIAISCGLIISELVSNSLKYAFSESDTGWIKIDLAQNPEGKCRLAVMDNGRGLPEDIDIHRPSTLGMQIVAQLIDQIGGIMTVDRENGTAFSIDFPPQKEQPS